MGERSHTVLETAQTAVARMNIRLLYSHPEFSHISIIKMSFCPAEMYIWFDAKCKHTNERVDTHKNQFKYLRLAKNGVDVHQALMLR